MPEIKIDNLIDEIVDKDFLGKLQIYLDIIINANESKQAFNLAKDIGLVLKKRSKELQEYPSAYNILKGIGIKAQFVALPLLENLEVIWLLEKYYSYIFSIQNYDLLNKFNNKLINIVVYEERDEFKRQVREALLRSKIIITPNSKLRTIEDWLRDYNVQNGIGAVENIKQVQYLTNLKNKKEAEAVDIEKLKTLFALYESLKFSTFSPEGFEEEIPIEIEGREYIFSHGRLEPLILGQEKINLGPPKTVEEKKIDSLKQVAGQYKEGGLEQLALKEEIERKKKVEDLQIAMSKYRADSLEAKVLKEEIDKLNRQ